MIRAVVFDLWNTLVQSAHGDPFRHLARLLDEAQAERFPEMKRDAMAHPHADARAFVEEWRARMALTDAQVEAMTEVFRTAQEDAGCFPETLEALEGTRRIARLGLLSNTQSFDMGFLDRLGLVSLLPVRGLSALTGRLKPDPEAFRELQARLGCFPGEIAMVGDRWNDDVLGALEAGWTPLWVNRAGRPRPELPDEADLVEVRSLAQVPEAIRALQAGGRCPTCLG